MRDDSRMNSNTFSAARTSGLSVPFATRQRYSKARSILWAPPPNGYLYFTYGARPRQTRPTDSRATCSARVAEPHTCADVDNRDVPSGGTLLPRPQRVSRPCRCFTRNSALRDSARVARRSSTIQWHATKISLKTGNGSRRRPYSSPGGRRSRRQTDVATERHRSGRQPCAKGRRRAIIDTSLAHSRWRSAASHTIRAYEPLTRSSTSLCLTKRARVRHNPYSQTAAREVRVPVDTNHKHALRKADN